MGTSHSLIQSITANYLYFCSAAISDAYPEGINVEYNSKKIFMLLVIMMLQLMKNIIQE